jgi:hypothetical protein
MIDQDFFTSLPAKLEYLTPTRKDIHVHRTERLLRKLFCMAAFVQHA